MKHIYSADDRVCAVFLRPCNALAAYCKSSIIFLVLFTGYDISTQQTNAQRPSDCFYL